MRNTQITIDFSDGDSIHTNLLTAYIAEKYIIPPARKLRLFPDGINLTPHLEKAIKHID